MFSMRRWRGSMRCCTRRSPMGRSRPRPGAPELGALAGRRRRDRRLGGQGRHAGELDRRRVTLHRAAARNEGVERIGGPGGALRRQRPERGRSADGAPARRRPEDVGERQPEVPSPSGGTVIDVETRACAGGGHCDIKVTRTGGLIFSPEPCNPPGRAEFEGPPGNPGFILDANCGISATFEGISALAPSSRLP